MFRMNLMLPNSNPTMGGISCNVPECLGEMKNACKILVGTFSEKNVAEPLANLVTDQISK
jgi:hypothetical protein